MSRTTPLVVAIVIAVFIGVILFGYKDALMNTPAPNPNDPAVIAHGKTVYDANCASCHGANLEGQRNWKQKNPDGTLPAPPHDVTGHTWHHADELLFNITKNGGASIAPPGFKSAMPAFADTLTDNDIWAVLAYIKSTWPEKIRDRQESLNRK